MLIRHTRICQIIRYSWTSHTCTVKDGGRKFYFLLWLCVTARLLNSYWYPRFFAFSFKGLDTPLWVSIITFWFAFITSCWVSSLLMSSLVPNNDCKSPIPVECLWHLSSKSSSLSSVSKLSRMDWILSWLSSSSPLLCAAGWICSKVLHCFSPVGIFSSGGLLTTTFEIRKKIMTLLRGLKKCLVVHIHHGGKNGIFQSWTYWMPRNQLQSPLVCLSASRWFALPNHDAWGKFHLNHKFPNHVKSLCILCKIHIKSIL